MNQGISCSTLLEHASVDEQGVPISAALFVATEVLSALGDGPDRRSDVFSLGVVLFEMLTGKLMFRSDPEDTLADPKAGLPLELRLILATALARDPRERFESASEFESALRSFARHASVRINRGALRVWLAEVEPN